jgi:hypothetical protein
VSYVVCSEKIGPIYDSFAIHTTATDFNPPLEMSCIQAIQNIFTDAGLVFERFILFACCYAAGISNFSIVF